MEDNKWISADPRSGKLVIRFRVKGFNKQFYIASGLKDTSRNREAVRLKRDAIANDIALGHFDPTLERYQFRASTIAPAALLPKIPKSKYPYNLLELWQKFTNYQETQLEQTTILGRYTAVLRYIKRLPTLSLEESPKIRDWLTQNTTKYMAWLLIGHYSQCCTWAANSQLIPDNPFAKFKLKEPRKKQRDEDYGAFTLQQRDAIIAAFENHPKHSYYSNLIKFLFWTGCRPGEAFALTWGDISKDCCKITINKSCNLYRILKTPKTGRSRVFTVKQGTRLQHLLIEMRSAKIHPNELVFTTKKGKPINSMALYKVWAGQKGKYKAQCYEYPGVVNELVQQGHIPYYLKPYATRHTFATWAITQGVSPDKVAKWIGDKIETVLKYYCHPNVVDSECPDF